MTARHLSTRERTLAFAVGGIAFAFAAFFLINLFLETRSQLQSQLRSKTAQLHAMRALADQEAIWKKRDAWLLAKQPRLDNQDSAGVQLLGQIKEAAKKCQVLLDHPEIGSPDQRGDYVSVSVGLETSSSWPAMLDFLHEFQAPEKFIVIEGANLKIDDQDHTKMRGHFKIARWFASAATVKQTP
jgi:hypothetical protein